jgi:hypothetical protein
VESRGRTGLLAVSRQLAEAHDCCSLRGSSGAATHVEPFVLGGLGTLVAAAAAGRRIVRPGLLNLCDVEPVLVLASALAVFA